MRRVLSSLAVTALFVLAASAIGLAQEQTAMFKVGFPFVVEGKTMPAGDYEIRVSEDRTILTLLGEPKGKGVFFGAITRLAAQGTAEGDTRVIFDKVGDTCYLSEVWLPGEDGFLIYAAKEKHSHQAITGQKKAE